MLTLTLHRANLAPQASGRTSEPASTSPLAPVWRWAEPQVVFGIITSIFVPPPSSSLQLFFPENMISDSADATKGMTSSALIQVSAGRDAAHRSSCRGPMGSGRRLCPEAAEVRSVSGDSGLPPPQRAQPQVLEEGLLLPPPLRPLLLRQRLLQGQGGGGVGAR